MNPYPYLKNSLWEKLEGNKIHPYSIAIYDILLMICNSCFWKDTFCRTDESIYSIIGISCNSFKKYRDELRALNLIDFSEKKPVKYKIIDLEKYKNNPDFKHIQQASSPDKNIVFDKKDVSPRDSSSKKIDDTIYHHVTVDVSPDDSSMGSMCHDVTVDVSPDDSIIRHKTNINTYKNNKGGKQKKLTSDFDLSFIQADFLQIFLKWLEYKKNVKKKMYKTQTGIEHCYRKLFEESKGDLATAEEMINHSIGMEWDGIYPTPSMRAKNNFQDTKQKNVLWIKDSTQVDLQAIREEFIKS